MPTYGVISASVLHPHRLTTVVVPQSPAIRMMTIQAALIICPDRACEVCWSWLRITASSACFFSSAASLRLTSTKARAIGCQDHIGESRREHQLRPDCHVLLFEQSIFVIPGSGL
jgi:hypothetical protein